MASAVVLQADLEKRHEDTDPWIVDASTHSHVPLNGSSVSEQIEVLSQTILKAIRKQENHIGKMFADNYSKTEKFFQSQQEVLVNRLCEQLFNQSLGVIQPAPLESDAPREGNGVVQAAPEKIDSPREGNDYNRADRQASFDSHFTISASYASNGARQSAIVSRIEEEVEEREARQGTKTTSPVELRESLQMDPETSLALESMPKINGAFGQIFDIGTETDLQEVHYSVESYYHKEGFCQAIASSENFINLTLIVICVNSIYIGVDSDWNTKDRLYDADTIFVFCENAFCAFFFFEWLVRFGAFRNKRDCLKDGWMKFDSALMFMMFLETWVLAPILGMMGSSDFSVPAEPLRLLRLLRLTRMARLMRSSPELVTMTKGLALASRAVCSSLLMVVLLIYAFAIVLHMLLKEDDETNEFLDMKLASDFSTVTRCMWILLIDGTFMDNSGTVLTRLLFTPTLRTIVACCVFLGFILLSALTVMNMLIGVICEVVSQVAQGEKDAAAIQGLKETILLNLKKYDNGTNRISKKDLMHVMSDANSKAVLTNLNVDRLFVMELQDMLFPREDSSVAIKGVMELMLMCRGDNVATVQTLAHGLLYISTVVQNHAERTQELLEKLERLRFSSETELVRQYSKFQVLLDASRSASGPTQSKSSSVPPHSDCLSDSSQCSI